MKLSHSERRTLGVVGAALFLLLVFTYGIQPLLGAGLSGEDKALANRVARARLLLAKAAGIHARHAAQAEALAGAMAHFPPDAKTDRGGLSLLAGVEKAALAAGLTLTAKGLGPAGRGTPPEVSVAIAGQGEPAAVFGFLYRLRAGAVRVEIKRLDLAAGEERILQIQAEIATILPRAKGVPADE
ncbi:MAG: hypothetical protein ACM3X6_13540 [Patescibacteria group bacterium]